MESVAELHDGAGLDILEGTEHEGASSGVSMDWMLSLMTATMKLRVANETGEDVVLTHDEVVSLVGALRILQSQAESDG